MDYIYANGELYHYGVKGMKWGVRRYQNKDGSLTPAGKKRYEDDKTADQKKSNLKRNILIGAGVAAGILAVSGAIYLHKTNSYHTSINLNSLKRGKYAVDAMGTDMVLPKGSTMFRTATHDTLRGDLAYASITNADKNRYILRMSDMYRGRDMYQMKIKALNDIKAPSEQKQFDMFVDLLVNDKKFSEEVSYNPYGITKNVFGNREAAIEFAKEYKYENFITRMIDYDKTKDDSSLSTFVNYVKKNGYNTLIDVNDISTTSDTPIIVLDPSDNLSVDGVRKLNAGMKFVAGLMVKNVK